MRVAERDVVPRNNEKPEAHFLYSGAQYLKEKWKNIGLVALGTGFLLAGVAVILDSIAPLTLLPLPDKIVHTSVMIPELLITMGGGAYLIHRGLGRKKTA